MNDVFRELRGRRIFITGHTGFKGSWLAFILNEIGADVRGYALPPTTEVNQFDLLGLKTKIDHVIGDVRDNDSLYRAFSEFQPEIVFHLAAQSLVRPSYEDPVGTFSTNITGSVHLLEAVRKCEAVRSLVFVTSDKCYENVEWVWGYRETDRLGGIDPYSASKAASELIFSSFMGSFLKSRKNFGAASARAGNVIGGGDWALDRIIPDCIRAIETRTPVRLRNPSATRPWQHVLEPISGYLLLAARLCEEPRRWCGAWNFGPSTEDIRTVKEVASILLSNIGQGELQVDDSAVVPHEAGLLQLNCDKANQLLRWKPRWRVDETLTHTASWYKAWLEGKDMQSVTRSQLREFFPELP